MSDTTEQQVETAEGCEEAVERSEFHVTMKLKLTAENIVKSFGDSGPTDAFLLTVEMDEEVGLWAYSILLFRHFQKQMEIAAAKCPELLSQSDEELYAMLEGE